MQLKVEKLQKKRQQLLEQQKEIEEEEYQIKSMKETLVKKLNNDVYQIIN
jgi:hypothetical protein